ncbi:MAG: hypothetical protein A2X12_07080 [Bacteroidetes bacterium GWE2_29_8]|nr:MAG: hypothetical protein A2X12_07080 [Bacteroidetes bacterium GWE2_29_8]OFY14232.1 MAG: hypothetical protein A2X02_04050 [Bacteroidetes bacterium GWF2_29_10]
MRHYLLIILFGLSFFVSSSQEVFEHVDNRTIYDFLDELSNDGFIEINSAVKPYSRVYIATKLSEAKEKKENLTNIQKKTLDFHLKDYNKELNVGKYTPKKIDLLYYKDSLFSFTLNPIAGFEYYTNQNGKVYKRYNGADFFGYIGKNVGFYASLRDNYENNPFARYWYLTKERGAKYKGGSVKGGESGGVDYSEMRGGMTFAWKWGSLSLVKDHIVWGNNYNGSNIISDKTPSYPLIKLNIKPAKWIELNYIHAWLVSEFVDSTQGYVFNIDSTNINKIKYSRRDYFVNKYLAANFVTIKPFKKLNISIGNSVVYDKQIIPAYLIPIFFYKSIDHTLALSNSIGQNAQMFMDVSSRQIKHLHLYSSIFIDEIYMSRIFNKSNHRNYYSVKAGARINNFLLKNYSITFEYTRTNPLTYKHFVPTTTFESNKYNLGYYLRDNSEDVYIKIDYSLLYNLRLSLGAEFAIVGPRYLYDGNQNSSETSGLKFIESADWKKEYVFFRICFQPINDIFLYGEYFIMNISGDNYQLYTQNIFEGKTNNLNFGINVKF